MMQKSIKATEKDWEKILHIRTTGRDESDADEICFPYEPTPYPVLERLALSGYISKNDRVLDYGCGKGRVCFFLASECGCRTTGIDFSEKLIEEARDNLKHFPGKSRVSFQCCPAQSYEITDEDTFFFFNPFRDTILHSVIGRIRESLCREMRICESQYRESQIRESLCREMRICESQHQERKARIFCYYPSDEFIVCLLTEPGIIFLDEIDCRDMFDGNNERERILIFEMSEQEPII